MFKNFDDMRKCLIYILLVLAVFFQMHIMEAMPSVCKKERGGDAPKYDERVSNIVPTPRLIRMDEAKEVRIKQVVELIDGSTLSLPEDGYVLECKGGKIILKARSRKGIAHARASLAQLCGVGPADMMDDRSFIGKVIPVTYIEDYPAFEIRGFMHDTGRNFREVEILKQELDLMAFYKLNVFHWHLTDNPAWRIECKAYPQLNDPQYQRKGRDEGRFYTYDQIRDVIAYACERGIMVIPEIDMPGHSQYFNTTFGFPMASEEGMKVLEVCLKEFMNEIPADMCPYIHIGSDEVRVADPEGFMRFCERVVTDGGRIPIAWLPGLPASDRTISQIWTENGRHTIDEDFSGMYIDSYMGYLNLGVPLLNTSRYFLHRLCGVDGNATAGSFVGTAGEDVSGAKAGHDLQPVVSRAMGGVLCLWNDVRCEDKSRIFPHNGMPEGLLGFAESGWVGGDRYGCENPTLMPQAGTLAYDKLVEFEKKIAIHRDMFLTDWNVRWVANAHIPWNVQILAQEVNEARGEAKVLVDTKVWGGCVDLSAMCKSMGIINEKWALVDDGLTGLEARLTTEIYVERDTVITAWVGFDSPARSNRRSDGIGEQGMWECGARVFVTHETCPVQEILPAQPWNEPGKYRYHHNTWHRDPNELPYTDEQFFWMRDPASVPLKAGWNTIEICVPRIELARTWIAAFVPLTVDLNGRVSEPSGISFGK